MLVGFQRAFEWYDLDAAEIGFLHAEFALVIAVPTLIDVGSFPKFFAPAIEDFHLEFKGKHTAFASVHIVMHVAIWREGIW